VWTIEYGWTKNENFGRSHFKKGLYACSLLFCVISYSTTTTSSLLPAGTTSRLLLPQGVLATSSSYCSNCFADTSTTLSKADTTVGFPQEKLVWRH